MQADFRETALEADFVEESTKLLVSWIEEAIADHGECILGLSGGSTPRPIYEALGKKDLPWGKVKIFLVDERYVPADHAENNQRMVKEAFGSHSQFSICHPELVEGLNSQFLFPNTSLPIDDCIQQYSRDLKSCGIYSERLPDIMTLGLGDDGHIASLFPPLSSLAMGDRQLVLHTTTDRFPVHDRITISLNAILAAAHHIFFLRGEGKRKVWKEMMASAEGVERWPAKGVLEEGRAIIIAEWP